MVVPESEPRSSGPKRKGQSVAIGFGALALVAGTLGIGAMTSPGPVAVETTTTSTSVVIPETPIDIENLSIDQIATGEPLVWEESKTLVEGIPIGLTNYDGRIYLFGAPSTTHDLPASGGLRVWRSEDGTTWEYLGEGIPPGFEITTVSSTHDGLMAATAGQDGQGLVLWTSLDGETWEPEPVPIEDDQLARVSFSDVAANDDAVVVSYWRYLAMDQLIADRMAEIYGVDITVSHWGWGIDEARDDPVFTLWGPFGFPLAEVSMDDLGLTDAEVEQVLAWNRGEDSGSTVKTRDSTGVWTQVELPNADWIDSISTTADGAFLANGGSSTGNSAWTSLDGIDWQQMSYGDRPYRVITWGDALVGPTGMNRASVLTSSDGDTWSDIGPGELFPAAAQWSFEDIAAGPAGILGTVIGWTQQSPVETAPIPPPTVRDGGTVLTFDYDTSQLTLVVGAEVYTWPMSSSTMPEGLAIDLTTGDIAFSDPETGEYLAAFSFDEIQEAEQAYWSRGWSENELRAIVFSPDGQGWTIQDPVASFGESDLIHAMEVGESTAVVVTYSIEGYLDPAAAPGFSVWTAATP